MTLKDSVRPTFANLISDQPSRLATSILVEHSQRIAAAYLLRRTRSGRLYLDRFDLTVEDLALDCLADLFRRDDEGRLVRLRDYAASIGWDELDDAGLLIALRRLIFSAVNEGLFRRYRESDPALGRLIRTLKQHARTSEHAVLHRLRGTLVLLPIDSPPASDDRPRMPPEVLEAHLHQAIDPSGRLKGVVDAVASLLRDHPFYAAEVTLPDLAIGIRNVRARRGETGGEALADADDLDERHLCSLIKTQVDLALAEVGHDMRPLYIGRRGVAPDVYSAYLKAVRDILQAQFAERGTPDLSFREALNSYVQAVGSAEYRRRHQAILEYLVTLTRSRFLARIEPAL